MKKIGFIGAYDKIDLILYEAKILAQMGERVLVIDATAMQKTRYMVPSIENARKYITNYEDIDIAIGFESLNDIKEFMGILLSSEMNYGTIMIDVDTLRNIANFELRGWDKLYFVSGFDVYSLKRGVELLASIQTENQIAKILYTRDASKEEVDYLNFLTKDLGVKWNDEMSLYLPFECGDQSVIYRNQRIQKMNMKKLSSQYKQTLSFIAMQIMGEEQFAQIKRTMKNLERGF